MENESQHNESFVSKEEAYLHAVSSTARNISAGMPHVQGWARSKVSSKPTEIFDINGSLLFYDFEAVISGVQTGIIRTSANKYIGSPVVSFILGERMWNASVAQKEILKKIRRRYKNSKIIKTLLVCYSYPKIGLLIEVSGKAGTKKLIFDIADYSSVPLAGKKKREGAYAWSLLDSLDDQKKKANVRKFNKGKDLLKKLKIKSTASAILSRRVIGDIFDLEKFRFRIQITKELQFCTHYNYYEPASHHCFVLHAQQVNDYCAVATCQMILCYYRYYYSQNDIAPALSYSPGGGCPPDQSPGYESLSNNHINSSFDDTATWQEARDQINLLQPFKSGIPGHARACAGYSYTIQFYPFNLTERKLLIYDPWPWNSNLKLGGEVYWEDWDSINHTNFVYTELDY